ncbi:hypothetical protein D3C87_1758080 [compost metagenome]
MVKRIQSLSKKLIGNAAASALRCSLAANPLNSSLTMPTGENRLNTIRLTATEEVM